ncbi:MAG TPA: DedA family protein [Candidatus Binataceae bacterium]|nr:DedA family protein [Candidatus Binataceae bacterium]
MLRVLFCWRRPCVRGTLFDYELRLWFSLAPRQHGIGCNTMIDRLMTAVSAFIVGTISTTGYGGIVLLMAIESACVPLPSEIMMPFSGYLVSTGRFSLNLVAIAGAVGCLLGSYVAYFAGANGGRRLLLKYGRYILIAPHEIELADHFFDRWGSPAVFISRLLPVVRTFIALPAGIARMRLVPFTIYTLLGSYIWCLALAWAGMKLGQHWSQLGPYFHRFDGAIAVLLVVGAAAVLYNRIKGITSASAPD